MSARKFSALVAAAVCSVMPWVASARETGPQPMDVHHWFEHERARIEGGDILQQTERFPHTIVARQTATASPPPPQLGQGKTASGMVRPDCIVEEMKRTEGYLPKP